MNWGMKANVAYMPEPINRATTLAANTVGMRIIFMSMRGWCERLSTRTHNGSSTTAPASRPSTLGEPQPHDGAWLSASSSATSQPASRTAPHQFTFPDVRTGEAGTKKWAPTAARLVMIAGIQNSQW